MSKMTARQRAALACLRVNHPRAEVSVLWHALDKQPLRIKVRMHWSGHYTRIVWLDPEGRLELGDTKIRDRQVVAV